MTDIDGVEYLSPYFGDMSREYLFYQMRKKKLKIHTIFEAYVPYLVFAEPQIGFCKLLQVPSSDRYGDLIHRGGAVAHLIVFEAAAFPYKKLFSNVEAPGMMLLQ